MTMQLFLANLQAPIKLSNKIVHHQAILEVRHCAY